MKTCGNRNYRKWLALMVSGGLAVTALAGCGGSDGGTEQSAQTEVSEGIKTAAEDNKVTTFALPDGSEESEIYVEPIADLPDDFIRGMDASAVLSLENSGVTYYNYEGKEQDVFETLAQSGVNYIRLRVWNDPYDADGNGYGGGNNDVARFLRGWCLLSPFSKGDRVRHEGVRGFPLLGFLGGPEETACTESLGGHECVGKERGTL